MTDLPFQPGQRVKLNALGLRWKTPRMGPTSRSPKWKHRVGETGRVMGNMKIVFVKWEGTIGYNDAIPVHFVEVAT